MSDPRTAQGAWISTAIARRGRIALVVWVLAGLVAIVAFDAASERGATIGSAFLLLTTALALWTLLRAVDGGLPHWTRTSFDQVFAPRPSVIVQLDEVEEIRRAVIFSRHSALDIRARLAPIVRRITDALLVSKYGWGLDAPEEWVEDRVGVVIWDTIRPQAEPAERATRGLEVAEIDRLVTALEDLARR